MGCGFSKSARNDKAPDVPRGSINNKPVPLTEKEIQMRLDVPTEVQSLEIGGFKFRYAWASQRGYYPDDLNKENQDAYTILPAFSPNQAFFGVFDGHGKDGHLCARFARDLLPNIVKTKTASLPSGVNAEAIKQALTVAHLFTNDAMHIETKLDDNLSGTTSITILFRGKTMYICNVGDSRAIVVSTSADGALVSKPLSNDQTPYRRDERERLKKFGARIMSMDQLEGVEPMHENWGDLNLGEDIDEGGDPPRVWSPHGDYPGTAFSRSFGDLFAEELGVVAEPEIMDRDLRASDKYVIIASDGVFEFLTNQVVAEMVDRFADPLEACKAVVAAAYDLWLQYEVRTDDISIIIFHLETSTAVEVAPSPRRGGRGSFAELAILDARPVRRNLSREKRKNLILGQREVGNDVAEEEVDMEALFVAKTAEESLAIEGAIKSNFLFSHLNPTQRQSVLDVMQPVQVAAGDWVIRQGDQGDRFYVIDSGTYEVRVKGAGVEDATGGAVVHVYESGPSQHPGFGELSLMYGKPRAATVIARTEGKLWALDRKVFKKVVMKTLDHHKNVGRTLKKVELLKCLNTQQMQRLADLLQEKSFEKDCNIITQGEIGDNFYLIMKGTCKCTINGANGAPETVVMQLKDNDYFGEKALLTSNPRAANVVTTSSTTVLYIGKAAFEEVLGPLAAIIDDHRARREKLAKAQLEMSAPKKLDDLGLTGVISTESPGPLMLGCFGPAALTPGALPNVAIRSFVISDVDASGLSHSVLVAIEASKHVTSAAAKNVLVPSLVAVFRDVNAWHVVYSSGVVCDLAAVVATATMLAMPASTTTTAATASPPAAPTSSQPLKQEIVAYIGACLVSALESLHDLGIIYRGVNPDGVHVDVKGRVVLLDYRVCKVGVVGGKSFTICGATDYLAPEQISQRGHGAAVDLWALGVLLYELIVGQHPFAANSEVATYAKISTFGSKAFPSLLFPEWVSPEMKSLINQLLIPSPEARLGAGREGFAALKRHTLFRSVDWPGLEHVQSPLAVLATAELSSIAKEGVDPSMAITFHRDYVCTTGWDRNIEPF